MSRLLLIAVCLPFLLSPEPLHAQDDDDTFALGLGLRQSTVVTEDDLFNSLAPRVYFAFLASEDIMVEPSLGLFRFSREAEGEFGTSRSTLTTFRAGIGFLFLNDAGVDGRTYWGPRVGVGRLSEDSEFSGTSTSNERWDLSLALVVGGEYFLVPGFSLGGEVGAEVTRIGDDDDDDGTDDTSSVFGTLAELRLRWYPR